MFKLKSLLLSFGLFTIYYFLFTIGSASADTSCQPIYGGGQTCIQTGNIVINKTVQNNAGAFVDNIGSNEFDFGPESTVVFQISVSNTGGQPVQNITIKDIFPQFIDFVAGAGNFNTNSRTLTFTIDNLNPNETRVFTITGKVQSANQLANSQSLMCVVNQAIANVSGNDIAQDNAQFCISKQAVSQVPSTTTKGGLKVFPTTVPTTTPSTGPEMLALAGLIPTGALGYFLRRRSSK